MAVDDGLYLPVIKPHTLEKIRRHDCAAGMFARGMSKKWRQRAYIGLYSGAGLARLETTGEVVETTALSALKLPFTHYVFVDSDPNCLQALQARVGPLAATRKVSFILGDVNARVADVLHALPSYSKTNGLLSFCFVDPFNAGLRISTLRALASLQMDFLILLALGVDVRRNMNHYFNDPSSTRIAELLDAPDWREEFRRSGGKTVKFVLKKFDQAMVGMGYQTPHPTHHHAVKVGGVLLYYLAYYSKHPRGLRFWESTLATTDPQGALFPPAD